MLGEDWELEPAGSLIGRCEGQEDATPRVLETFLLPEEHCGLGKKA